MYKVTNEEMPAQAYGFYEFHAKSKAASSASRHSQLCCSRETCLRHKQELRSLQHPVRQVPAFGYRCNWLTGQIVHADM